MLYSRIKDPVSGLTHFIGALLAVAGLVVLVSVAVRTGGPRHIVSFAIFGTGMILLYTASTLYHWLPVPDRVRFRLRKADHMMIFVLIAATYTPVCLIALRGVWGWGLFGAVWFAAVLGITLKICWKSQPRWVSTTGYVVMGWMALAGIWPLVQALERGALLLLFGGGLFYSLGALIYALKYPDPWPARLGYHEIFHVLVMLGTFSHFWMMYRYIAVLS